MKTKLKPIIVLALLICHSALLFSADLKEGAVAIVKNSVSKFEQTDNNNGTYTVTEEITILNANGVKYGYVALYADKFRELQKFTGEIRNAEGKVIKKIKKGDLVLSTISASLATDSYDYTLDLHHPTYPYTVFYTYEMKYKGIISYPSFVPQVDYMIAVENAEYTLTIPQDVKIRQKSNFDFNLKEESDAKTRTYTYSVSNLQAQQTEPLAPPFRERMPILFIAPTQFCYEGYCGDMETWNSYGNWVLKLLENRDQLPANFVAEIKALTESKKTDKEKVEVLYDYLQNHTRYVSIQLGIGGLQPFPASDVAKTGFGDCKGLSNLMKAMLKAIDIPSYYCEIYNGNNKELYSDFASVTQTNHAILMVPLASENVWLECTSQTLPFAFVHSNIAGHDALAITEKGGQLYKLPECKDEENKSEINLQYTLSENGNIAGNVQFAEYMYNYEKKFRSMSSDERKDQVNYITGNLNFPKINIDNINYKIVKDESPSIVLKTDFHADDVINKSGNRLFVPLCPLKKGSYNFFRSATRKQDIVLTRGYIEMDTIKINIPSNYTVETLPSGANYSSIIGSMTSDVKQEGDEIIYTQKLHIKAGRYSKNDYEEIKNFFSSINGELKARMVLKKE